MATTISADNGSVSGSAGLKSSADSSGILVLQSGANTTAVTTDASQNVALASLTASKPVFTDASKNFTSTGTAPAANGGTGFASYAVGDLLYADTTTTLAKLADVATGNALISGGVSTAPSWGKIGLTTHVSGTLPVANGGTGVTSSTGSGNNVLSTSPTLVTPLLGTPTSGTLSNCTVDGTNSVGYLNIPQNSQSAAYTLVLADAGKSIYHPGADTTARIWTIPANSSVAFPIGTAVTFINDTSGGVITIAITTDTLVLAGAGTTGSRTLAANGMATAIKMTSTRWMISGAGLT